jgi:carbon monoxide dehydrogenase subunit G
MDMTGEQRIAAPRQDVWEALNDTEVLKACIPGCKSLEKLSDTEMKATVTLAIGPVKASFAGDVTLSDIDAPNSYVISGQGSGGAAGFAKGQATVNLADDGDGTLMTYVVKADVGGKLAQLGGRLIDATAKKLANDFFRKFGEIVAPPAEGDGADAPKTGFWKRWFKKDGGGVETT